MNCPNLYGQHKKAPYGSQNLKSSNILTSFFKRSQFCFKLNSFVVVKVNVFAYEDASILISFKLSSVNTFSFKN